MVSNFGHLKDDEWKTTLHYQFHKATQTGKSFLTTRLLSENLRFMLQVLRILSSPQSFLRVGELLTSQRCH